MTTAHYLAYYELHEIPWKLPAPVRFRDSDSGMLFELGHGPYHVPRLASPIVSVRAGGARIEMANENYTLEGGTYFGVAVPVHLNAEKGVPLVEPAFEKLFQLSDDAARVVGLCLDQRTPLKKLAAYVGENRQDSKPGRMIVMWQALSGAAALISGSSVESVRSALDHALRSDVSPQALLALRWYDQSKNTTIGPDRFVALWIALEALMGPVRSHKELVRKTAAHLAGDDYRLDLTTDQIRAALGLDKMREYRNHIMHRDEWPVPWPVVPGDPARRDWPQILSDLVGEILRTKLSATATGTLKKHINDGLGMLS